MAFPKKNRLKNKKDLALVFKNGRAVKNPLFLVRFTKNHLSASRSAVVVPSSFSKNAAHRNYWRRKVLSVLEKIVFHLTGAWDVIVVVFPKVKDQNFQEITSSLEEIFQKANIV